MKKTIFIISIFCCTFFYSQKSQSYLQVGYASICCGTPSEAPVVNSLKKFQKRNRIKNLEILIQNSLGREGEYNLYIGLDRLTQDQKKKLIQNLSIVVAAQNNKRKQSSDGIVNFDPEVVLHQSDLINARNVTIYKKIKEK